jgi:hypothetical protein
MHLLPSGTSKLPALLASPDMAWPFPEKSHKFVEIDVRVGAAAEDQLEQFIRL